MTTVSFSSFQNCLSFTVTGHAEYAESGKDIVCSAVSILAYTLAEYLLQKSEEGIIPEPDIEIQDGEISIKCEARNEEEYKFIKDKFEIVESGYNLLHETYPKHVSIKRV